MGKIQGFLLYRIYYGETLVYVGRTKQPLQNRIRGHLFAKPIHRKLSIEQVSKIEYARFQTEADMNLYEIYFILKWHPLLNVDDKTRDNLTVELPEVKWELFTTPLWEKWYNEIVQKETDYDRMVRRYREIPEAKHILRGQHRMGVIDEEELKLGLHGLDEERDNLYKKLWGKDRFF